MEQDLINLGATPEQAVRWNHMLFDQPPLFTDQELRELLQFLRAAALRKGASR